MTSRTDSHTVRAPLPARADHPHTSGSRRRWLVLIAMTGALSMIMLDQTVVSVALPSMSRELPLSATGQQWVVNAYVLAMASLVALGGKLGDRCGGVTTFRTGVVIFFLASAGSGLAPTGPLGEPWLIATRLLQGAGAALMMPASAAIVIAAFGVAERGRGRDIRRWSAGRRFLESPKDHDAARSSESRFSTSATSSPMVSASNTRRAPAVR